MTFTVQTGPDSVKPPVDTIAPPAAAASGASPKGQDQLRQVRTGNPGARVWSDRAREKGPELCC
jgi:hypothetical protein